MVIKLPLVVYLAGGITGLTYDEAFVWRQKVTSKLEADGIKCYNPIQADDIKSYNDGDDKFTSGDMICYLRDRFMVVKSDIILINYNTFKDQISVGTLVEKGWSDFDKLIIIVSDEPITHPFITGNTILVKTMEEAVELIRGLQ